MVTRQYAREKFAGIFKTAVDNGMVLNAERSVFNFAVQDCTKRGHISAWEALEFRSAYKHKLNGLLFNLQSSENPELLASILAKEIECKHLAFLSPEELDPKKWKEINERVVRRFPTRDPVEVPESALLKCGKCKSKRCTFYLLQTRSADEP
jgi:transcription elongation factor S-II